MNSDDDASARDERFYTPRAQAASARSLSSYGTPRCRASSSASESEFGTPRCSQDQSSIAKQFVERSSRVFDQRSDSVSIGAGLPRPTRHSYRSTENNNLKTRQQRRNISNTSQQTSTETKDILSLARHNRVEQLERLLIDGVSPDLQDDNGNSILSVACQNGNKRIVKLVLRYGADINNLNYKGNTALHFCFK